MNEININVKTISVKAETRPLRASWTTEMVADISYHTDIENSIQREIEIEMKKEMRKKKIEKILKHIS